MGKIAFLFPGQGAQKNGLAKDFLERGYFEELTEYIPDLPEILIEKAQENPELAIASHSLVAARKLQQAGLSPDYLAGFSLGEITALIFSQALSDQDGFHFINLRSQAMAQACQNQPGAMVAVNGLDSATIEKAVDKSPKVWAVNFNAPSQTVLSGEEENLSKVTEDLQSQGARCIKLRVKGAFHSPFMAQVSPVLADFFKKVPIQKPKISSYSNRTGQVYPWDLRELEELLCQQVQSPVLFVDMIENLYEAGVRTFIEVGPGRTLGKLVGKILIDESIQIFHVADEESLLATVKEIKTSQKS